MRGRTSIPVTKGHRSRGEPHQAQEQRHHYPAALAGYVQYLAAHFSELQETLPRRYRELRAELQVAEQPPREPGQLAHLLLGLETFLDFAVAIGAITADVRGGRTSHRPSRCCWGRPGSMRRPMPRKPRRQLFLRYLAGGFAGKRAYLEDKQRWSPDDPWQWGWEQGPSRSGVRSSRTTGGTRPARSWSASSMATGCCSTRSRCISLSWGQRRRRARVFPVDQRTLIHRLDEAGLLETEMEGSERRRKVNVWIGGATKRVLKLRRDAVIPPSPAEDREDREDREDPRQIRAFQGAASFPMDGKAAATGKDFPAEDRVVTPILPGLPGLPGDAEEGGVRETEHEEVAEWRG